MRGKGHDEASLQFFEEDGSWIVICDCGADFRGTTYHDVTEAWSLHMERARSS